GQRREGGQAEQQHRRTARGSRRAATHGNSCIQRRAGTQSNLEAASQDGEQSQQPDHRAAASRGGRVHHTRSCCYSITTTTHVRLIGSGIRSVSTGETPAA
ncbi:hypothetical protein NDU88_008129, partial [Pleurodeles waltl]